MITAYTLMAAIVAVEVVRRFLFSVQAPWSTSIPIYLFLWVTWLGASYGVRNRSHLSFSELRARLPYKGQFACLILDAICWIGFATIVIIHSVEQVQLSHYNFSIVQGTDDVMQWWFYTITPLAWSLIVIRTLQNLWGDVRAFRCGEPFKQAGSMRGD